MKIQVPKFDIKKNSLVWDGVKDGFYEAYYVQVNDPVSGMAWWFRYSILVPQKGRGKPYAALWAVQFDQSGVRGPLAMKQVFPINHFRYEKDRFILYIEDGFMTNSHATGKIKHGYRTLEWDIQWTPIDNNFVHYPEFWYKVPYPRSKVVSPHWATTGGGFVRWNDGEFFLSDALVHVGHVWGTTHSKNWVWVHTHGFEENSSVIFEGLWIPVAGRYGLSMCWLGIDGQLERATSFSNSWQTKRFYTRNEWPVKFSTSRYKVDGIVTIDPAQIAGLAYHDPDGSHRFCYNSKVATLKMDLFDKKKGDHHSLTAPSATAFELCRSTELKDVPVLV